MLSRRTEARRPRPAHPVPMRRETRLMDLPRRTGRVPRRPDGWRSNSDRWHPSTRFTLTSLQQSIPRCRYTSTRAAMERTRPARRCGRRQRIPGSMSSSLCRMSTPPLARKSRSTRKWEASCPKSTSSRPTSAATPMETASRTSKSRRPYTIKTCGPPGCLRPSRMTPSTFHRPPSPWRSFTESRRAPWRISRSITRSARTSQQALDIGTGPLGSTAMSGIRGSVYSPSASRAPRREPLMRGPSMPLRRSYTRTSRRKSSSASTGR